MANVVPQCNETDELIRDVIILGYIRIDGNRMCIVDCETSDMEHVTVDELENVTQDLLRLIFQIHKRNSTIKQ